MIDYICHNDDVLAIIIRNSYYKKGIEFLTPPSYSMQLGYMNRPAGYVIKPHVHNKIVREVKFTKEVLFLKSGKVRVDFYDESKSYLESYVLNQGDVIFLAYGAHGFEMIEESEIIEVKQGPYSAESDKIQFKPVSSDKIMIKE